MMSRQAYTNGLVGAVVGAYVCVGLVAAETMNDRHEARQQAANFEAGAVSASGHKDKINSDFATASKGIAYFNLPDGRECAIRVDANLKEPSQQLVTCGL